MQKLAKYNNGYRYLLCCYDVLSKHAWVQPIKDKQSSTVANAFAQILKKGRKPWWIYTDKGKEFTGSAFQNLMMKNMVTHITTESPDIKAANAERYIRTLKTRLWKYFTDKKTFRYLNVLQDIVQAINSSYSSTIGCRPIDITQKNEKEIRERLYGSSTDKKKTVFEYNIGDKVRIAKERTAFKKGYIPNFTEEVFVITKRIPRRPVPVYRIEDLYGEQIQGTYYPAELVQSV
ncbi:MAG: transposase family protein [Gammaproteobacteria bacterium]|nr:transposase family protein [Gammaproteobacteria bacterium]